MAARATAHSRNPFMVNLMQPPVALHSHSEDVLTRPLVELVLEIERAAAFGAANALVVIDHQRGGALGAALANPAGEVQVALRVEALLGQAHLACPVAGQKPSRIISSRITSCFDERRMRSYSSCRDVGWPDMAAQLWLKIDCVQ